MFDKPAPPYSASGIVERYAAQMARDAMAPPHGAPLCGVEFGRLGIGCAGRIDAAWRKLGGRFHSLNKPGIDWLDDINRIHFAVVVRPSDTDSWRILSCLGPRLLFGGIVCLCGARRLELTLCITGAYRIMDAACRCDLSVYEKLA
jgi:hypothetical protein